MKGKVSFKEDSFLALEILSLLSLWYPFLTVPIALFFFFLNCWVYPKDSFSSVWLLITTPLQTAAGIYSILQTFTYSRWIEQYISRKTDAINIYNFSSYKWTSSKTVFGITKVKFINLCTPNKLFFPSINKCKITVDFSFTFYFIPAKHLSTCLTLGTSAHKQELERGDHKYILKCFAVGHADLQGQIYPMCCSISVHNFVPGYFKGEYISLLVH